MDILRVSRIGRHATSRSATPLILSLYFPFLACNKRKGACVPRRRARTPTPKRPLPLRPIHPSNSDRATACLLAANRESAKRPATRHCASRSAPNPKSPRRRAITRVQPDHDALPAGFGPEGRRLLEPATQNQWRGDRPPAPERSLPLRQVHQSEGQHPEAYLRSRRGRTR